MKPLHWSAAPDGLQPVQRANFLNVQLDALGVGLAAGAAPFLAVFLVRLGASNTQVGLITAMPAVTGFLLAIIAGQYLNRQRNIVRWLSASRLIALLAYTVIGLVPFISPPSIWIPSILAIWAASTLPSLLVNISFNVVMNAVAGPRLRYELLSRRWSVVGLTTAVAVAFAGQMLDIIPFPVNYQSVFVLFSLGGVISYVYARRIRLPEQAPAGAGDKDVPGMRLGPIVQEVRANPAFSSFVAIRFVYFLGSTLSLPIFPLFYVRVAGITDAWIGLITTVQTATMLVGYRLWTQESRARGSRFVLLSTTLGLSLYPLLVSLTRSAPVIATVVGVAGVFQAGLDLVFFDELMKTIPEGQSAMLVSIALSVQYLATIVAPLVGTLLAGRIGIATTLVISSLLRFTAFLLFALTSRQLSRRFRSS